MNQSTEKISQDWKKKFYLIWMGQAFSIIRAEQSLLRSRLG